MIEETTFETVALTNPPAGICARCAEHALEHIPTGVVFARCRHTEISAYRNARGEWKAVEGLSAGQFKRAILHGVFVGEQRHSEAQAGGLSEQ